MVLRVEDKLTSSNCYIIEENKKALIIDPNNFMMIKSILEEKKLKPEIVMLTHEHCDHVKGLEELRRSYKVKVVSSEECSNGIQNDKQNMSRMMEVYLYFKSGEKTIRSYKPFICRKADETFKNETVIRFENHEFKMISMPGHTLGSTCIVMDDFNLFSGDYLLEEEKVITRLPSGSLTDYESKTKPWLKALPLGIKVFPGHGKEFILTKEVMRNHEL